MSVKARIVCGIALSSIGATAGAGWLDSATIAPAQPRAPAVPSASNAARMYAGR